VEDLWHRVEDRRKREAVDGDTAEYERLMEAGELLIKLTLINVCALLDEDRGGEPHRYRTFFEAVRAMGVGGWCYQLQQVLTGPSASAFEPLASVHIREITQKVRASADDCWQYEAVAPYSLFLSDMAALIRDGCGAYGLNFGAPAHRVVAAVWVVVVGGGLADPQRSPSGSPRTRWPQARVP